MAEPPPPAVNVRCPHCGAEYPVREAVLGRLAKCTACEQRFVLRVADEAPTVEPPPTQAEEKVVAEEVAADESSNEEKPASPRAEASTEAIPPAPPKAEPAAPPAPPPFPPQESTASAIQLPPPLPPVTPAAAAPSLSRGVATAQRRWTLPLLRFFAASGEVLALIGAVGAVIHGVVLLVLAMSQSSEPAVLLVALGVIAATLAFWLYFVVGLLVLAQSLRLALMVEENTRQTRDAALATAGACEGLRQPATGAPSAAPSEPPPGLATTPDSP